VRIGEVMRKKWKKIHNEKNEKKKITEKKAGDLQSRQCVSAR